MYRQNNPRVNVPRGDNRGQHLGPGHSRRAPDDFRKNVPPPRVQNKDAGKSNQPQAPKLPSALKKTFGPEVKKWKSSFTTVDEDDKGTKSSCDKRGSPDTSRPSSHLYDPYEPIKSDSDDHPSPEPLKESQKSRSRWDIDADTLRQQLSAGPPRFTTQDTEPAERAGYSSGSKTTEHRASEHRASEHRASEHRASEHRASEHRASDHRASEHRASEHRASEHRASEHRASGYRPEDYRPEDYRPEDYRPEDYRPEDYRPEIATMVRLSPPPLLPHQQQPPPLLPHQQQPPPLLPHQQQPPTLLPHQQQPPTLPLLQQPPQQLPPQQLPGPQLHPECDYKQSSGFSGPDPLPPPRPEVKDPNKNELLTDKNLISCDLCEVELSSGQELEEHLDSKTHWDTLEFIQKHNNYDDMTIAFLQDVMLYKSRKCSRAIEDTALQALQEYDHMTKVEMFHCAACNTFVSTCASAVQNHITTQGHITNTKGFKDRQRRLCLSKAGTMINELTPQFQSFVKGISPFE